MDKLIFLIRHGQSEANANTNSPSYGVIDPLTQKGQKQAISTGKIITHFWDEQSLLISSTLERALQTSKIILENIHFNHKINIIESDKLIEKEKQEQFDSVNKRFNDCIDEIIREHEDYNKFFIITHGHVIQSVISSILASEPNKLANCSNCGISIIVNKNKLICFNNILHMTNDLII